MGLIIPIVAAGLLGVAVLSRKKRATTVLKPGSGEGFQLPSSVTGTQRQQRVTASSGRSYNVSTWPPNADDQVFALAELVGSDRHWVSYFQDRKSGKRMLVQVFGPTERERAALLSDFRVPVDGLVL